MSSTRNQTNAFSLRQYLEAEHGANLVTVDQRMNVAGIWCQRNRHRSVRELVRS